MATTLTAKGQVTIPKKVRDALQIGPGSVVEFAVNPGGEVVVRRSGSKPSSKRDRFDAVRGKAQIRWKTDELMALLRG
jgi:AbrB family looped-hinge helix DNA binding protein